MKTPPIYHFPDTPCAAPFIGHSQSAPGIGVSFCPEMTRQEYIEAHAEQYLEWMRMATASKELKAQYDRLRGANISGKGAPIDQMIDQASGRLEAEAMEFFDFLTDCFLRIKFDDMKPANGKEAA